MSPVAYKIALLPGDGIGPEVLEAAVTVLDAVSKHFRIGLRYERHDAGAELYRRTGESISPRTMEAIESAHAVLFGAAGLPDVRKPDGTEITPQIDIRERFGLFASLRPCRLFPGVPTRVKAEAVNMLVIRETTEGLFAGRHDPIELSDESVSDRLTITRATSERLFALAFEQARSRRQSEGTPGHVTLLDKSNVLRSNAFMRKVFDEVAQRYPDVTSDHLYIDAASMMLVTEPERFDVVVTENVFGDITSEIAAGVVGGLGIAPSGDISLEHGVFQPSHGTAPSIAGQNKANPVATILSAAMLLDWLSYRHSDKECRNAAAAIRSAVEAVLREGPRTPDIGGTSSTGEVTSAIVHSLEATVSSEA
ncbi:isocitrate/isopropylmalate dehydrogenase family protein [Actinacidiphila oryziradicis]|uniref:3-isopropylmalate dehydrogenase n=1 Tax=Actinacidiphila oryziradicis TaxID=2571141 RepID=A0A4U0RPK5_9ACTN|nr:isocitrate/isopropylmalate dehydrogenase family protein [Actinacidiphila oryziradicis]TJZ97861.1 isocitrate/isopropylmalate dehydrogenase family protein [Actinacidiphila oryziradicis]